MEDADILFYEYDLWGVLQGHEKKLFQAIDLIDENRFLQESIDSLCNHFEKEYVINVLQLYVDQIYVNQGEAEVDISRDFTRLIHDRNEPFYIKGTAFYFFLPFTGDRELLKCRPSAFTSTFPYAKLLENEILLTYNRVDPNPSEVRSTFDRDLSEIKRYIEWINNDVTRFNDALRGKIVERLEGRRQKVLKDQSMVTELGFPVRKAAESPPAILALPTDSKAERLLSKESSTSKRQLRIFLCHSSGDKPVIREIYKRLAADGIIPWLDEEDLLPGQKWEDEIPVAVRDSDIVLVCLSHESINKKGYVQKEIKYALDIADEQPEGTIFIIPLRLEECSVPSRLSHLHYVDFFHDRGYERLMRALDSRAEALGFKIEKTSLP